MASAEKVIIEMAPGMVQAVRESVEAGDYASTSEAVEDALRVWRREREEHPDRLAEIKSRVRRSFEDPRPSLPVDEVRSRLGELHAETVRALSRETS